MSTFRIGIGRVDITPPIGIRMQGYASRRHGALGIHDHLAAAGTAMDDGKNRIAIVTCDLIGLDHVSVERARSTAAKICEIDREAIMINCSHTHGGPATGRRSYVKAEKDYVRVLERQIATAVALAVKDLKESTISIGRGFARIGANRRACCDGKMTIGVNPDGPIDPEVLAMRITNDDGRTICMLFNHSCHGTTLGGDNYLITADYIGYARRTIERALQDHRTMSSYINGAAGNINPHPRGTFELAKKHGTALGTEVLRVTEDAEAIESPTITYARTTVDLPLSPPPLEDRLRAEISELESNTKSRQSDPGIKAQLLWGREMIRRIEAGEVKKSLPVEIQAMRIGTLGLLALPGEVFVEIGLEIKNRSPLRYNMIAGYSNGNIGYIPTARAFEEGGYEPNSHVYLLEQKLAPTVEEVTVSGALGAIKACL